MAEVVYPRLRANVGDRLTLTTIQNQTVSGVVVAVEADEDGGVVKVALQDDPDRNDPVWVRGDLIALWRFGKPVQVQVLGSGGVQPFPVSPEMLRNLRQQ